VAEYCIVDATSGAEPKKVIVSTDFSGKVVDTSNCVRCVFTSCIKYMLILMDKIITGNVFVISVRL
jgi:hypothetical protein